MQGCTRPFLSTLSLRRATWAMPVLHTHHKFLSTLSLRRATSPTPSRSAAGAYFYPRSPCGERPLVTTHAQFCDQFLSTLSLRRATETIRKTQRPYVFLSTLSLRRATSKRRLPSSCRLFLSTLSLRRATVSSHDAGKHRRPISIHALLAESDRCSLRLQAHL